MVDHTTSKFAGLKKSNEKNLADKINKRRVIIVEVNIHELMQKWKEKEERSMQVSHLHKRAATACPLKTTYTTTG